jgi:hypothetical protein
LLSIQQQQAQLQIQQAQLQIQQQAQLQIQQQQKEKEKAQFALQEALKQQQIELIKNTQLAIDWVKIQCQEWTMMEIYANQGKISAQAWVDNWSRTYHVQCHQVQDLINRKVLSSCQCQQICAECLICKNNRMKKCGLQGIQQF